MLHPWSCPVALRGNFSELFHASFEDTHYYFIFSLFFRINLTIIFIYDTDIDFPYNFAILLNLSLELV